jgi:hypothetical protein
MAISLAALAEAAIIVEGAARDYRFGPNRE